MDSVDGGAAASTGDRRQHVNKKNRDWHKRLDLRKTAVQTPAMQSQDKRGPKKIAEEWERGAAWPSSEKPPRGARRSRRRTHDSGNTLRFTCSQCRDNSEYVPKDLVRHFGEKHRGSLPVFPCHTCTFSTQEFSYLQVHLLSHKDTFSSCSICNDNVQRTWPEFSAHLTMCHCKNGQYSCEMCQNFSTGDVKVFLEHTYGHNLGLEGAGDDLLPHTKDGDKFGPKTTAQALCCQHCGYEASQKWLLAKHVKAVHVRQNGTQRKKNKNKKEVHSIAMKPNDPIPKIKPRLTRSAVREMCWLTQDCLSLPGREFLDKYCHLSDPQTTLEETQQFLMKSVAGETGDQKWTKALKTVLSNVPQDINLHPKSENGITSNSSELTVLTVKNKITVAQNGAAYAKRLQMMTSSDKETLSPESVPDDACCVADQNGCQSNLNDNAPCPQTEAKPYNDSSVPVQHAPSEPTQMEENRENQQLKKDQEMEEHGRKHEEPVHEDEVDISSELQLTNTNEKQMSAQKVIPKNKRRNRKRKRKTRCKKVDQRSLGLALKLVLKKNPVKEKQWVSQTSLASGGRITHAASEETVEILQDKLLAEAHQKKWTKAFKADFGNHSKAVTSVPQSNPGQEVTPSCAIKAVVSKNTDRGMRVVLNGSPSMHQEMRDDAEESLQFFNTDADDGNSTRANWRAAALTEVSPMNVQLQTSGSDSHVPGNEMSAVTDSVTPHYSYTKSSSVSHPVITPQGEITDTDLSLACPSEQSKQSVQEMSDGELTADSLSDLLSNTTFPAGKAMQQEPSPACGQQRQLLLKKLERTLKLVAINPSQLVKRPAGDQPVVVLNHPDADIPEVARIMEVINRYRGEVQKVILSRRTVKALSAMNGEAPETNEPTDAQPDTAGYGKNSVQERFLLKLTLRRLSRKKYEVVGAVSPSRDDVKKFRCWFCGRAFASQEPWKTHRQRHLMEWKRPNCENS